MEAFSMELDSRADGMKDGLLEELNEFLRMPSISAREGESGSFATAPNGSRAN
jgi:hypothetical protein